MPGGNKRKPGAQGVSIRGPLYDKLKVHASRTNQQVTTLVDGIIVRYLDGHAN
jgi:hypothetical protein